MSRATYRRRWQHNLQRSFNRIPKHRRLNAILKHHFKQSLCDDIYGDSVIMRRLRKEE